MTAARLEPVILEEVNRLVSRFDLGMIELVGADERMYRWVQSGFEPNARDAVQASFPVGLDRQAKSRIRFVWNSDS